MNRPARPRAGGQQKVRRGPGADPIGRALRASEARFRLLVESVKDYGIFMLDPEGRVATWNPGAERIKGYRADEIVGKHFSIFYPEDDARSGKCEYELEVAAREGRFEDEGWRVRKDGSKFWANIIISALRDVDGRLVGFGKVTRDLTERREAELERIRLAKAEEAVGLRDEFISIASHELRTPLSALQLQLQLVRNQIETVDPLAAAKIDRAAVSGRRLGDLIDALLDVSRISTGQLTLHPGPFDLAAAAGEVVERMQGAAAKARCPLSIQVEGALPGIWDQLRVEQVITNLVSNALKYAAGTPVTVAVSREANRAVVRVVDGGPGIPEADLVRIFERFERASNMRHFGGMGLGLYVARQIVVAHGGSLVARNLAAGGASFTVRLPISPGPATG